MANLTLVDHLDFTIMKIDREWFQFKISEAAITTPVEKESLDQNLTVYFFNFLTRPASAGR